MRVTRSMSKREKILEEGENTSNLSKKNGGGGGCDDDKMEAALKNDLILETIFNLLLWKELNVVRQVCKDWHRLSLPIWRRKAPTLCLLASEPDSDSPYCPMISQFLTELMHGNGQEPQFPGLCQYKHFEIVQGRRLGDGDWKVFNTFLEECGSWITKLTFSRISFVKLDDFKKVMSCSLTPSVQYLKLTDSEFECEKEEDDTFQLSAAPSNSELQNSGNRVSKSLEISGLRLVCDEGLPVSWTELLQWYPGLQHLRLAEGGGGFWRNEVDTLFKSITKLRRRNPDSLRLKSLDLAEIDDSEEEEDDDDDDRLGTLLHTFFFNANNDFHLETFGLHITTKAMLTDFHRVLVQQSTSLKRLLMRINEDISLENFQIPDNNILENIILFGETFRDLTFLKQCPNLKSLALKRGVVGADHEWNIIENTSDEDMDEVVLASLREFCCEHDEITFDVQDLDRLNRWMPNLKSLEVCELSAESFRLVCELWPSSLEELKFGHRDDVDDEVITGIPLGRRTRLYFNLTDLKELRCLQLTPLHHKFQKTRPMFTDKTYLLGFLQLPKLTSLTFTTRYISQSTLELLEKKIPDTNWSESDR